ncbi:MAG: hypothetical protein Q9169_006599 [Polycauliona sp. 2 TL-2023]
MLLLVLLSYLLSLVSTTAIPATPPPTPQSLTPSRPLNAWPFTHSITFDVPNSDVRVTLKTFFGRRIIHPERIQFFFGAALDAVANDERRAGTHTPVNLPESLYRDFGLVMNIVDHTVAARDPDAHGGKMQWGELRAIYQGVWAHMGQMENEQVKIEAWRMETKGRPRYQRKVKHLGSGAFQAVTPGLEMELKFGNGTRIGETE